MIKKIILVGIVGAAIIASLAVSFSDPPGDPSGSELPPEPEPEPAPGVLPEPAPEPASVALPEPGDQADVIMPIKTSRPGCEEVDLCYVPSRITVEAGESVTWLNEDVAFHSVTSGSYGEPTDMFDSGYLDPHESFTVAFEEPGVYDYYCTLHPWMEAQVVVE